MSEKILGYVLLAVGILIIIAAAANVLFVFRGSRPVQFLNESASFAEFSINMPTGEEVPVGAIPVTIGNNNQITRIINLVMHVIFAGLFVSVGFRIAMIGANLVRPIVVKSSSEKILSKNPQL
ncbi:hypothetical protein A2V80_01215 [Candidatus Woesebacteria bacterium RBG_16_39_8b]|uniref:Uncharacterized protein n=1 Tax=Candidatus Woesebacteria bacterium RBG_16_39_8b TaxID=1802482 RepID=A0A1F7XCB6_9BACT|nr:MAG: hypothetical protein A2V80_01215 [Candidatus Woesebacteria bacterium RBG_16_39_8b]